jgi:hypothetical protein
MEVIYLKSALKSDSFDISISIKIPFSRVSVTIESGRSLLTVRYHDLFDLVWDQEGNLDLFRGYRNQEDNETSGQSYHLKKTVSYEF